MLTQEGSMKRLRTLNSYNLLVLFDTNLTRGVQVVVPLDSARVEGDRSCGNIITDLYYPCQQKLILSYCADGIKQ